MTEFRGTERFQILRPLGAGGMGVVYLARDRERDLDVALKTLARVDARGISGLKNEFRALAGVTHPNLVTLHELFCEDGQWFFTMEVVSGTSFLDHVRADLGSLDPDQTTFVAEGGTIAPVASRATAVAEKTTTAIEPPATLPTALLVARALPDRPKTALFCDLDRLRAALRQLAEAVFALHAAGKLHRDVKPTNVLVAEDRRVVLLDFGLAVIRAARWTEGGSTQRLIEGTPAYMAPEQTIGEPATPASDWYAVGVMLHEALTGQLPFGGDFRTIIRRKRVEDPLPPSAITRDIPEDLDGLCLALLHRVPGLRPSGEEILRRLGGQPSPVSLVPSSGPAQSEPRFVGRAQELSVLRAAFARAREGETVVAHVRGRSGMGKSALVDHFLDAVWRDHRALVLSGRCYERESVPFKAWDTLVDALVRHLAGLPREEVKPLLPPGLGDLARVFPVLLGIEAVEECADLSEPPDSVSALDSRRRAFEALKALLGRLAARRPLVLHVDDLQWGDVDSAKLLLRVLSPPDAPPLLFIAGYRSDEAEASELIRELCRFGEPAEGGRPSIVPATTRSGAVVPVAFDTNVVVEVDRLAPEEVEALARAGLGAIPNADALCRGVAREADGSPFFVAELVRDILADPGAAPALSGVSLEAVLRARIGRLPPAARGLLETLAVAARPIEQGLAARAAALDNPEEALAALRAAGLIRARGLRPRDHAEPYHDRIRVAVVGALDAGALRARHHALARALEAAGGADIEALAVHFEGAGEREAAAGYAARAAEHAAHTLAFDRAARLYRMAIDLGAGRTADERRALTIARAHALVNAGRGAEAAPLYLTCAATSPAREGLELRRRAAEQLLVNGRIDEGSRVLREVLRSVDVEYPESALRATLVLLGRLGRLRLRGTGFKERPAREIPPEDLSRIDCCYSAGKGLTLVDPVRGLGFLSKHLLLSLEAGEPGRVCAGLSFYAISLAAEGGPVAGRVRALLDQSRAIAAQRDDPYLLGVAGNCLAATSMCLGRWRETVEEAARANEILRSRCNGASWEIEGGVVCSEVSLLWMGRLNELSTFVQRHVHDALDRGDLFAATYARMHTWYARIAADDPARARAEMREAIARWSTGGFHVMHFWALYGETQYDLYAGDGAAARERIKRAWPALEGSNILRVQFHRVFITLLRGTTAVAAAAARSADRARLLRDADRDAERLAKEEMPYATPCAALLRACAAAADGRDTIAGRLLNAAISGFEAADMELFAACARRRRGELVGGEGGRRLVREADTFMRGVGIVRPDRWTAMYAPGFGER